jgi:hypothetical protein
MLKGIVVVPVQVAGASTERGEAAPHARPGVEVVREGVEQPHIRYEVHDGFVRW